MEIKIPLTKIRLGFRANSGGSTCNGNGYKTKTLSFTVITEIGNGDDGSRGCTGDPKNFASVNTPKK